MLMVKHFDRVMTLLKNAKKKKTAFDRNKWYEFSDMSWVASFTKLNS